MAFIPLSYNFRSLRVRKTTTAATAGGIALVVFVFSAVSMLGNGITKTLGRSGSDDVAIVMSKGADAELSSNVDISAVGQIAGATQVRRRSDGTPDATSEIVGVIALDKIGTTGISNVTVRGVQADVFTFRSSAKLIDGRKAAPGGDEVVIGKAIRGRFKGVELGESFEIKKNRAVKVVGVFEDNGSSYESEVWGDIETVRVAFSRQGVVSSVRVRLQSASEGVLKAFRKSVEDSNVAGQVENERAFYEKQSEGSSLFITIIGTFIAVLFSFGAMIGAMITMYSAVANRSREIGTLRALGFSRFAILMSFILESLLLSLIGGVVGASASFLLGFVHFSMINMTSWSEIVFSFEPTVGIVAGAMIFASVMGFVGGLFPAIRAARVNILTALRGA